MPNIRCVKNYVCTVVETTENGGQIDVKEREFSMRTGKIFPASEIEEVNNDCVNIVFNNNILFGIVFNIPKNVFEIVGIPQTSPTSPCCSNRE